MTEPLRASSPAEWASRIVGAWLCSVNGIIETGHLLVLAKKTLAHGDFERMIEAELPFKPRTARRLMIIAKDERLTNRAHAHVLPPVGGRSTN